MNNIELIGYIAATLGAISLIPEVIKALHTHHLKDVSWLMLLMLISGSLLWGVYSIFTKNYPLLASACINCANEGTLIYLKFTYEKNKNPLLKHHPFKKEVKATVYNLVPSKESTSVHQ